MGGKNRKKNAKKDKSVPKLAPTVKQTGIVAAHTKENPVEGLV